MSHTLLFEIGVEELPSSFVDAALAQLPGLVSANLDALRLDSGAISVFGTPRRLAWQVHNLSDKQRDLDEEKLGPSVSIAFEASDLNKPTKAAFAFAEKYHVHPSDLQVMDVPASGKQKAGRYVYVKRREAGEKTSLLLPHMLEKICAGISFPKSMRWGEGGTLAFGRPIQWLLALLDKELISMQFAGIKSDFYSFGHRFLSPKAFKIDDAQNYESELKKRHVVPCSKERENLISDRVAQIARDLGGDYDKEEMLIRENRSLVEEPFVIAGQYDPLFLDLPPAVIRSVARGHQKYFCVQKNEDELLPYYIAVVNTAENEATISAGMNRVMRARLSDARFFFEEDKKVKIDTYLSKLDGIVFHHQLGSVRDKIFRMEKLVSFMGDQLALSQKDKEDCVHAAKLCKFDLASLMVGEFPELQGHMGRVYAKYANYNDSVSDAIRDHYMPLGSEGTVAPHLTSKILAIADRIDTLASCFAIGLSPTGSADPFALRRNCLGVLRTMIEPLHTATCFHALSLFACFSFAFDELSVRVRNLRFNKEEILTKIKDFFIDRLRGLLASHCSPAVADAVLSAKVLGDLFAFPGYALARAQALHVAVQKNEAWLIQAQSVAKRLSGISKESVPVLHPASTFEKKYDRLIYDVIAELEKNTLELRTLFDVEHALKSLAGASALIDEVFTQTLVNDPNDKLTPKRLELLSFGASCMLRIADMSRLASFS